MEKRVAHQFSSGCILDFKYLLDVFQNILDVLDLIKQLIKFDRLLLMLETAMCLTHLISLKLSPWLTLIWCKGLNEVQKYVVSIWVLGA